MSFIQRNMHEFWSAGQMLWLVPRYPSKTSCGQRWDFSGVVVSIMCDSGIKDVMLILTHGVIQGLRVPQPEFECYHPIRAHSLDKI